jgi:filamentous hemagglutinin
MIMNHNTRTKKSFRFSSLVALMLFINQFIFISFASAMSNGPVATPVESVGTHINNDLRSAAGIEKFLNTHPEYVQKDSGNQLYQKADFISNVSGYKTLTEFKESIKSTPAAGKPLFIPIMTGGITTFIQTYPLLGYKMLGDGFVNTRVVVHQIEEKIGRKLITSAKHPRYKSEKEQYNALLNNAKSMAAIHGGLQYSQQPFFYTASMDLIWPELRIINGQPVIVPIVHLTNATVNRYKVKGNVVDFHKGAEVKSASLNGVDISLGRDAVLKAMSDITLINSSVNSTGSMKLIAGGTLSLLSSQVNGKGNVSIAGKTINAKTLVHRYDFGGETGGRYGEITSISSESGNITLRSYGDLNFYGVKVDAGKGITIAADGNIKIGSVPLQSSYSGNKNGWSVKRSEVEYLTSKLNAVDTIKILASGKIEISGAEIVSDKGHIELLGALGVTIIDENSQYQSKRKGKFGKKKVDESVYQTVAIRSVLDAGKGIKLSSEFGDITLRSVDFTSQEGTEIKATSGGVNLLMSSETDHYSYSSVKKSMWNTVTRQKGHNKVTGVPNAIVGGLAVEAFNGVVVEFVGDPNLSVSAQLDELSNIPALWYLSELRDRDDVDFEAVLNIDDSWKKSQKTLSPAAIAVITIAVAVAAGPAAGGIATTVGGATGVAVSAAFTSLVTTASISLANGNSIEKTLASLSSDENLRSLAVTMVTAGAIAQIDASFFPADSVNIDAAIASNGTQASVDAALNTQTSLSLQAQIAQAATHSAVRAGVNTLAYGGDFSTQFAQSLTQHGVNVLGQHMANKIGAAFDTADADSLDTALKYISHAGSGCMLGVVTAANSGSSKPESACGAGAGGAVIGEFIASQYRTSDQVVEAKESLDEFMDSQGENIRQLKARGLSNQEILDHLNSNSELAGYMNHLNDLRKTGVDLARFGAAAGAFVSGANASNITIASDLGANAAENNALFLLFALPVVLTAIDVALMGADLFEIYEAFESGDNDRGNELLLALGIETLAGAIIPGDKILSHIAKNSGKLGENATAIISYVKDKVAVKRISAGSASWGDIPSVQIKNADGKILDVKLAESKRDHVLKGEYISPKNVKGGHSTNSGDVVIVGKVETGVGDVRKAKVEINGHPKTNNNGESTLFPESWSDEDIMREFSEGLKLGSVPNNRGQLVTTPGGVKIQYYTNPTGSITTFYPLFEEK